jgi:methylamine dehydrogenase accessory protein MauD
MTALLVSNIVLWIVVIALVVVLLALTRQLGVLHERIAPAGALMLPRGPAVGERLAPVAATTLGGVPLSIGAPRGDGRSTLLLFVSPTCPVCKALLPVIRSSREQEKEWLEVVLASDGDEAEHRRYVEEHDLGAFPYVNSAALGLALQVGRLPHAALLDSEGVLRARGLVNSREHLESLFEAKRLGVASLQEYFASRAGSQG